VDTEEIEKTPEPFVLQTALNDYYVEYEINAYTKKPKVTARIYNELQ
jgi:small-conductance mechanosensitive channel